MIGRLYLHMIVVVLFGTAHSQEVSLWHNPANIVSPKECGSCHRREYALWQESAHATHHKVDDQYDLAEYVKNRMGVLSMKHNSLCVKCHYTGAAPGDDTPVGVAGVSCESCHGPAKEWINLHNTVRKDERNEERQRRFAVSEAHGMVRSTTMYSLASKCYQCHLVPEERLVNDGGHVVGSLDFELSSAMKKISHNFLHARFSAGDVRNSPIERRRERVIFVLGKMLSVEHLLRLVGSSEEKGRYRSAGMKRLGKSVDDLSTICETEILGGLAPLVSHIRTIHTNEQRDQMINAADTLRQIAEKFTREFDGMYLQSLDKFLTSQNSIE